jgi:hypothetical protein
MMAMQGAAETATSELRTPRRGKAQKVRALGVLALGFEAQSIWRREENSAS